MHIKSISLSTFLLLVLLNAFAVAEDVAQLTIDSTASSVDANLSLQANVTGNLIGNYDEVSIPEGTQTRPGLFGGQGNLPVDMLLAGILAGEIDSQPTGSFDLQFDLDALTISISNFEMDALGANPATLGIMVDLEFETFRTFQPDSLYLGIPVTLPLGDGSLTILSLQQSAPVLSVGLNPIGKNRYSFALLVPATVTFESEFFDQILNPGPLNFAIPLAGELEVAGDQVTVTQSIDQMVGDEIKDIQGVEFNDLPLPLPTVLPPGSTANLLLNGAVDSLGFSIDLSASLSASGTVSSFLLGDMNGDGVVSLLDVALFVDAIIAGNFLPEADINGDGVVDLQDVAPFVELLVG